MGFVSGSKSISKLFSHSGGIPRRSIGKTSEIPLLWGPTQWEEFWNQNLGLLQYGINNLL